MEAEGKEGTPRHISCCGKVSRKVGIHHHQSPLDGMACYRNQNTRFVQQSVVLGEKFIDRVRPTRNHPSEEPFGAAYRTIALECRIDRLAIETPVRASGSSDGFFTSPRPTTDARQACGQ